MGRPHGACSRNRVSVYLRNCRGSRCGTRGLCLDLDGLKLPGFGIRASHMWGAVFSFGLVLGLGSMSGTLFLPLVVGVVAMSRAMALRSSYGNAA